ncbi:MAG TPA: YkvA family protein [Devosia sp.]|nr:YkvA family protein [Devosia sp.]
MTRLFTRFLQFRSELVVLWRAFMTPETPMHLKVLMLLVPLYLVSPIDLIPDFIPIAGWLDDMVIVPMLVSFIVAMLPRKAAATRPANRGGPGQVIETTYRRK